MTDVERYMLIELTSNFCVYSVEFRVSLLIYGPTGHYIIEGSFLRSDTSIQIQLYTCLNTSDVTCNFAFTINHCSIGNEYYNDHYPGLGIVTVYDSKPHYHSLNIMITNSTFFNSHLTVKASTFTRYSFTMDVQNVTFNRGTINLEMPLTEKLTNLKSDNEWLGAHVLINDCQFMVAYSGAIDIVLHPSWPKSRLGRASQHPEIVISHSNFQEGNIAHHNVLSNTVSVEITRDVHKLHEVKHKPLLTLVQTTFQKDSKGAAIELKNLQGNTVLAEGNQIVSNEGFGLLLNNTQVEFQGYNEISSNASIYMYTTGGTLVGGDIYLSCDSQLLLKPHSLLNMSGKRGLYGGGLYIQ